MRKLLLIWIILLPLALPAQQVWTEGTEWVVTFDDGESSAYTLSGYTTIDGVPYLQLLNEQTGRPFGYVRTERGDTLVYARGVIRENITEEFLLYDFGTFQPGTSFSFGCYNYSADEIIRIDCLIESDSITYFHDVITQGDIMPCCYDVMFKVGYIGGPMALFYDTFLLPEDLSEDSEATGPIPRTRNVSHMVFRPKGKMPVVIVPTEIRSISGTRSYCRPTVYSLQGIPLKSCSGIFIQNGKKYLMPK